MTRILLKPLSFICTGLMAVSANAVSINEQEAPVDLFSLSLEELMQVKITSATRTEESLRTVPSSVSVFTREQMGQLGVDYLHELLNYVPGFQAFRQEEASNEYYHSSRGHRSSTSSREVLILLDGQRLNREFDNATAMPMLSLGNAEKIEFIRGPGSAIYGSNAFLGVISITTLKGVNAVSASAGTYQRQGQALMSGTAGELSADLAVHAMQDRGERLWLEESTAPGTYYPSRDPRSGEDINLKLGWQDASLHVLHVRREAEQFYVLGNSSDDLNETGNGYDSVLFTNRLFSNDDLAIRYNVSHYRDYYRADALLPVYQLSDFEIDSRTTAASLQADWSLSTNQHLLSGMEYRHVNVEQTLLHTGTAGTLPLIGSNDRDIASVYLQHQWQLSDEDALTTGLRYDTYSQIGSAISPRAGWTHQWSDHYTGKLLYGEAFRAPTTNEQSLIDVGVNLAGNPDLKPETIKTWEAVWMGNWEQHSLVVTLFHNSLQDGVVRDITVTPNTFINADNDESWQGIELEYIGQLSEAWQWRASYSQFGNLSEADLHEADKLASLILNYQHSDWNFNLSASRGAGRSMLTPSGLHHIDAEWLLGSKLQYAINRKQNIYLQASNLFDTEAETPYLRNTFGNGLPDRGRELTLGFSWRFD